MSFFPRLVVLFACATALFAQSQANTGTIEGTINDPSGKTIPGAEVTILNVDTNFTRVLTTDTEGRFRGVLLPLGAYKVTVKAPNFGTLIREGINLAVGQTVNLSLNLNIAGTEQTISVTGDAPVVETDKVEQSSYIDQQSIRSLPNNGRNFLDFVTLTPGVSIVQGPDGNEISINGQKGINNNVSIDGGDDNNPFFGEQRGGQRPAFTVNLDAVKEFQVVADGAPAEFGRSSGGFINVVTKSGTNEVHGTAHEFQKWSGLTARQSDGTRLRGFSQEQFGGTIGGPIRRNKLFFFAAYDQQIFNETKQTNPARIDPVLVNFFATKFNDPNENGPIKRTNSANAILGKIDWAVSDKHLATFRYNYSRSRQENGTFDVDPWARSANAIERDFANTLNFSLNSTLTPTTLNEFRFQYSREDRPRPYSGPQIPGQSRPFPDTGIDFGGQYRFGEPFFIPVQDHDDRAQFVDNISLIRGAHNFKLGLEYNRTNTTQTFVGFANGRFIFDSVQGFMNYVNIGPKFVECSNGTTNNAGVCPAGTTITGPLLLFLQFAGVGGKSVNQAGTQSIPQNEPAFFVQDRWQIRPNLTLSYGLRWEGQIEPPPITPPSQVFYSAFIGKPGFPSNGKIPSDLKQWQPRLGISWDPTGKGKTVIRVNGGIFYARTPGLELASSRTSNGSVGQTIFRASFFNGFGVTPPAYTSLIPDAGSGVPFQPGIFVFDRGYRNPRTYSWSGTVEQALTSTLKVYSAFNYAKGVHITRFVDRNDAVFGSPWSTGLGADGKNGLSSLTTVESSAKSLFRGWTLGMVKQYSSHFQFQWNYQLSTDYSDDDQERDPFNFYYRVANNFKPEYSYSARDERHRFNAFMYYSGPWGLEFSPRFSAHSAQPTSINGGNTSVLLANGTVVPRNTVRKDNAFTSFDFRVAKRWHLAERAFLEGTVDAFNLFNSKNLKQPQNGNLLFNFDGTLTSGLGDPRQAQLGVKLIF
ncbi:MAG: TonB-dependent receptor [Acidobacteriota bacterium]|nr:TonB-dependent receptor [Acidobacteriota bacterium]